MTWDVVIAGGGPNGLALACELGLAGVRPLVLESLTERSSVPKANGLVGQVVRLLDQRGLHERITGSPGAPRPTPWYMFGGIPLDLGPLESNPIHTLPVPQRRLEQLLEERAGELGVEIRRGQRLTSFTQDDDGVTLEVTGPDGPHRLRTAYLVGCDGGRSTVRKQLGIGFPGVTGDGLVSRAAHVSLPGEMWVAETGELEVPGYGRVRPMLHTRTDRGVFVVAQLEPGKPLVSTLEWDPSAVGDDTPMTIAELRESASRVLGADLPIGPPTAPGPHVLRRVEGGNTRLAERYRDGRVLLVGDAAHVHSAVGGPGLNLGIQDAANLGWKLAAQVHGWAPPGLLDTYHDERHPVGERVFMHSQAQLALLSPGPGVTALRELLGELLGRTENVQHIADTMAGSDIRYPVDCAHPLAGRFAPDLALTTGSGTSRLAELMRGARPLLLDLTGGPDLRDAATGWKDRVDTAAATSPDPAPAALLIRPDGYVAWAASPGEPTAEMRSGLRRALTTWFGAPAA
ncbi:FAD-dependent monooxygenase [Streptacidiphilus griseoplanus]|uniref:FAD-dependent monooxygenase n=1 Tax=Peterkaempfera griseoplana TaxID=66896 RepID=UPI000AE85AB5|nr:FAD-dependent monooxygenase [Peterkaempfera griseoplana]